MTYFIFDLETTTYESARKKANVFDPRNKIVLFAGMYQGDQSVVVRKYNDFTEQYFINAMKQADVIIGHNIKFDLLYMIRAFSETKNNILAVEFKNLLRKVKLYDTMFAEYLITAQQSKFASLNEVSLKYGGTLKDDRIKEFWEAGIQTDEIPEDILEEYARYDVLNTHIVYEAQQHQIRKLGIEKLISMNMDDLLATTIMEWNGLKIDVQRAQSKINELGGPNYDTLNTYLPNDLPFEFNWKSNDHLSAFLFGGDIKYTTKEEIGRYKTGIKAGEIKYKNVEKTYSFKNRVGKVLLPQVTKKTGVYRVDDTTLSSLLSSPNTSTIVSAILQERDKAKQISTYYEPMIELSGNSGQLHAELVHVQTNTGRLSSRNPNIQNWSKGSESDIKSCVVSRWGNDGYIVELDAMQLEIVCQAYLSNDPRMLEEIDKGTDFHCLRLATKKGLTYDEVYDNCKIKKLPSWDKERTLTKAFSFQRAYGAGVFKISAATGLSENAVKELIETEKELFPEVERFNSDNIRTVEYSSFVIEDNKKASLLTSATGRRYYFEDEDAPDWLQKKGIMRTFSPTQIKNYPIQGFGAEVLAFLRGELVRKLLTVDYKIVMINTVHDSILFDVKKDELHKAMKWLLETSNSSFKRFTQYFELPYLVDIKYEAKYGPNWKDMIEYKGA
jgi:DNA polymerase-1